jgi:hypothetical protein
MKIPDDRFFVVRRKAPFSQIPHTAHLNCRSLSPPRLPPLACSKSLAIVTTLASPSYPTDLPGRLRDDPGNEWVAHTSHLPTATYPGGLQGALTARTSSSEHVLLPSFLAAFFSSAMQAASSLPLEPQFFLCERNLKLCT